MDSGCPNRSVSATVSVNQSKRQTEEMNSVEEEQLHTSCGHGSILGHRLVCWVSTEEEVGLGSRVLCN